MCFNMSCITFMILTVCLGMLSMRLIQCKERRKRFHCGSIAQNSWIGRDVITTTFTIYKSVYLQEENTVFNCTVEQMMSVVTSDFM